MNILFVCLGNICRSPLAEGILKSKIKDQNIIIESAGFESYHINEPPDPRAIKVANDHGLSISENRCRLFIADDFDKFDVIYVMDEGKITASGRHDELLSKSRLYKRLFEMQFV